MRARIPEGPTAWPRRGARSDRRTPAGLLCAVGLVVAVVTWLQRRDVAATLSRAIQAAKGLIKEYDEASYTAEDVAKIDAARQPR